MVFGSHRKISKTFFGKKIIFPQGVTFVKKKDWKMGGGQKLVLKTNICSSLILLMYSELFGVDWWNLNYIYDD